VYERVILRPVDKGEVTRRLLIAGEGVSYKQLYDFTVRSLHPFLAWHLERVIDSSSRGSLL
jgi:hypothetical protein